MEKVRETAADSDGEGEGAGVGAGGFNAAIDDLGRQKVLFVSHEKSVKVRERERWIWDF